MNGYVVCFKLKSEKKPEIKVCYSRRMVKWAYENWADEANAPRELMDEWFNDFWELKEQSYGKENWIKLFNGDVEIVEG